MKTIFSLFDSETARYYRNPLTNPQRDVPIYVQNLNCKDGNSHLNECTYKTYGDCSHELDMWLECKGGKVLFFVLVTYRQMFASNNLFSSIRCKRSFLIVYMQCP